MKTFSSVEDLPSKHNNKRQNNPDMASFVTSIFNFLLNNPEISKISMLADLSLPNTESNSSISYKAIYKAISDTEPEDTRKVKAFMLLASIQSAF